MWIIFNSLGVIVGRSDDALTAYLAAERMCGWASWRYVSEDRFEFEGWAGCM